LADRVVASEIGTIRNNLTKFFILFFSSMSGKT
jgi:hypothetical protein